MKLAKKKRLEKAKVKLKAKKLPRGHNITNTSFKAKKIVIPRQLQSSIAGAVDTHESRDIEVLLSRLTHFNSGVRLGAIINLKSIIGERVEEIFNLHFSRVINGVAKLITDFERKVRSSCLKVLEIILSKASSFQIEPHAKVLSSHLMCGMTHIDSRIRSDALNLLDVILKYFPKLIIDEAASILPTFLNLISTSKYHSELQRFLNTLDNKDITDSLWRLRVLSVLANYFKAFVSFSTSVKCKNNTGLFGNGTNVVIEWDGISSLYIGDHLKQKIVDAEKGYLPGILENQESGLDFRNTSVVENERKLKYLVESLMPLLFHSWAEVAPKFQERHPNSSFLPRESSVLLFYILEIIIKLCESLENWDSVSDERESMFQWFTYKYISRIVAVFWKGFPYVLQDNAQDTSKIKEKDQLSYVKPVVLSPQCVCQNLSICFLILNFKEYHSTHAPCILEFVQKCIKKFLTPEILPLLKKVITALFTMESNIFSKSDFASSIIKKCQKSTSTCKHGLFSFLCDFLLTPKCPIAFQSKQLSIWVASLPGLLLENEISFRVVEILRVLACQNHKLFMENLRKEKLNIVDSLCKIKITECGELEGHKAIVDILFRVGDFNLFRTMYHKLKLNKGNKKLLLYVANLQRSLPPLLHKRKKVHRSRISNK